MERRIMGNIPSISREEQEILKNKHVLVVGCGGIGCYVVEYLLRVGVGCITVIDPDSFEESNKNRQLYAISESMGKSKVVEARERAMQINPDVKFEFWMSKLRTSTAATAVKAKDLVIDALDSREDRLILEKACAKEKVVLIHGAVAGWSFQVMTVTPGEDSLQRFYDNNKASLTSSTLSFVPAACGAVQCAEAVKVLCGKKPSYQDVLLYCDMKQMQSEVISPEDHFFAERQIEVVISKYNARETYTISEKTTVREIVSVMELEGENLFVMRNGRYVDPEQFDQAILEEGDLIELRKSAAFGG